MLLLPNDKSFQLFSFHWYGLGRGLLGGTWKQGLGPWKFGKHRM